MRGDMQVTIHKKFFIDLALDSSETIMFTKGGKHKTSISSDILPDPEDGYEIEISVQMQRDHQGRFDFIAGEAQAHTMRRQNEAQ